MNNPLDTPSIRKLLLEARNALSRGCWGGECCVIRERIDRALQHAVDGRQRHDDDCTVHDDGECLCLSPNAPERSPFAPGEGTWSAFASKVLEQRDTARAEVRRLTEQLHRSPSCPMCEASRNAAKAASSNVEAFSLAMRTMQDQNKNLRTALEQALRERDLVRAQNDRVKTADVTTLTQELQRRTQQLQIAERETERWRTMHDALLKRTIESLDELSRPPTSSTK